MRAPFARTPGRRRWPKRFAPELCAVAVYVVMVTIFVLRCLREVNVKGELFVEVWAEVLQISAGIGYALAGTILLIAPVLACALAFAAERSRGTLESMMLTPLEGRRVAWGRYLNAVTPWLRFFLWTLPVYMLLAGSEAVSDPVNSFRWDWGGVALYVFSAFCPKPIFVAVVVGLARSAGPVMKWSLAGGCSVLLRFVNDISIFVFATGAAFFCSVRARTTARALLGALLVLGALLTVLAADTWMVVGAAMIHEGLGLRFDMDIAFGLYIAAVLPVMLLRFGLGALLVHRAVRNFERYALSERS